MKVLTYEGLQLYHELASEEFANAAEIQTALTNLDDGKVDKDGNKVLSTNDYTTVEKNKLAGIAAGAEVNQNAFSNVTVGSTTISADGETDTLTIVAGSNITLTPDATNDKITITAKDTTYSNATTSAAGLMSADDKTNLNTAISKLDGIEAGANKTVIDTALSSTSTNPVQNKVINSALSGKQATIIGAATTITGSNLTTSKALVSNSSGKVAVSSVSSTELGYLSGVTSSVQTQIDELDANKVDKVDGKDLSSNDFTSDYITKINNATTKLSGIAEGANKTTVDSSLSSTSTNPVQNKVINSALSGKVDKVDGKSLSTNDFTNTLKSKLDGIASGAQVNQNAFSNITDGTTTIAADSTTDTLTLTAGSNISLALDATNDKVTISATNTTYGAAGSSLGLVKSGGDVTISSGTITVNDDSHNHVISNVDGLQNALDAKVDLSEYETFKTNVNTLLDSDDETLDQMSEIVAYTKNNKGLIDSITTSKQDKITGAATTITSSDLTANRVLISDGNGKVAASSSITTTELGYLDGTTSNIQTQITAAKNTADAKLAAADITVTVTGTGNAITAASYDDKGTITLTKGATFNNYSLPTASSTLGGVKTTSTVTSASGYTAVPIIDGIPYYKNVTKTDVTNALGYTPPTTNTQYTAGTGLSLSNGAFSVKTGYTNSGKNYKVQADSSGNLYVNVPWTDSTPVTSVFGRTGAVTLTKGDVTTALGYTPPTSNTTYSAATYSTLGLVKPAYTSTGAASLTTTAATNTTTPTIAAKTTTSGRYYAVEADKNGVLFVNVPWSDTNTHAVSSVAGKTGAVTLTKSDVGLGNVENKSSATIRGELTKANVTTALGYTPPTTDTNTHYTTRLYAGASGTAANAAATNPYLKITDDNTYRNQIQFKGSGATTVSSDANGVITISSTDTNTHAVSSVNSKTGAVVLSATDVGALATTKQTGTPDLNDIKTTGYYSLVGTPTNAPASGNAMLFVDYTVGTPFQFFMHDATFTIYKRSRNNETSEWRAWDTTLGNSISGNAATATTLSTTLAVNKGGTGLTAAPSLQVNLASTSAVSIFAASPRPGVTGTLKVGNGGTGITSNPSMLVNLGSTSAASVFAASPRPGITGTLGIGNGGTGATSKSGARTNLGITSGTTLPSSASEGDLFLLRSNELAQVSGTTYTTSETLTGDTWVDGKPIYRQVFIFKNKSIASGTVTTALGAIANFSSIETILKIDGTAYNHTNTEYYPLTRIWSTTTGVSSIDINRGNIRLRTIYTSAITMSLIIQIYYTKA